MVHPYFQDQIDIVLLNVDNPRWQDLLEKYEVKGIPQLNFFDSNGNSFGLTIGVRSEEEIQELIDLLVRNIEFPKEIMNQKVNDIFDLTLLVFPPPTTTKCIFSA